jgi:hypothetical protein
VVEASARAYLAAVNRAVRSERPARDVNADGDAVAVADGGAR